MSKLGGFGFALGLISGAYLIGRALNLFAFPESLAGLDKTIYLVLGFLLIVAGIYSLKSARNSMSRFVNQTGTIRIILYFIFALYFANLFFNVVPAVTSALSGISKWIGLAGGILLVLGGFSFWRVKRY